MRRGGVLIGTVVGLLAGCGGNDSATPIPLAAAPPSADVIAAAFPPRFDRIAPLPVAIADLPDGTRATYVDTGPEDGVPVLFLGGFGTSATTVEAVEFLASARERLGIRLISPDRNGYGDAEFYPDGDYQSFVDSALAIMDSIGANEFSIVAISGGGPYAAAVARAAPERIRSLHLAAAYTGVPLAGSLKDMCATEGAQRRALVDSFVAAPEDWWAGSKASPVGKIPGWMKAANADARRTFKVTDGGKGESEPLAHELDLYCEPTEPDLAAVDAPAFLYSGLRDRSVPIEFTEQWADQLNNVVADRRYPDSAHDVMYTRWAQVLVDLASPDDPRVLACVDGDEVLSEQASNGKLVDSCAWNSLG